MAEFEDAINSILSSPQEMEKIMGLARELSGTLGGENGQKSTQPQSLPVPAGGVDPKLVGVMTRIMGEYSSKTSDKQALVNALKPYLKEERRESLDRAVKIALLAHVARTALREFGGDFRL